MSLIEAALDGSVVPRSPDPRTGSWGRSDWLGTLADTPQIGARNPRTPDPRNGRSRYCLKVSQNCLKVSHSGGCGSSKYLISLVGRKGLEPLTLGLKERLRTLEVPPAKASTYDVSFRPVVTEKPVSTGQYRSVPVSTGQEHHGPQGRRPVRREDIE